MRIDWGSERLTKAQEYDLIGRIRAGREAEGRIVVGPPTPGDAAARERDLLAAASGLAARDKIARDNLPLVSMLATRFAASKRVDADEAFGYGQSGLLRAIELFDPAFGVKFGTYACRWIKQAMQRNLRHMRGAIVVPVHQLEAVYYPGAADPGRPALFALDTSRAIRIRSLDAPMRGAKGNCTLGQLLARTSGPSPSDRVSADEERELVAVAVDDLTDRESAIVSLRYGIGGHPAHTLKEIGHRLGLCRERVRQIERDALAKLRTRLGAGA